jgi:hypothetical protein
MANPSVTEPPEIPPPTPGTPTVPPVESPPGNPRPEVPPPQNDPAQPPNPPQELPGGPPNEIPTRGLQGPRTLCPIDKPGIVDLHRLGAGCDSGFAYSTRHDAAFSRRNLTYVHLQCDDSSQHVK